ncbi:MAG: hypothetical protein JNJ83_12885 [Verrucomicrobiaceae bacterium]|nr:hypothetical protein [Verrucomicrobiaceae bacterium]
MNFDLIFLSYQVALLVLVGSVLAAVIAWLLRSWAARMERAHLLAKLDAEHDLRARLQEQLDQTKATTATVSADDKAAEEQCLAALQQRDEAERQASEALNRARGLQEQLERAQRVSAEYETLRLRVVELEKSESQLRTDLDEALSRVRDDSSHEPTPEASVPIVETATPTLTEVPAQKPLPSKLFSTPVVHPPVEPIEPDDEFEFPPAPTRPIEDIARHRAPLREGPKPDAEKLSALLSDLREMTAKAKSEEKRKVLEARATMIAATLARIDSLAADPDDLTEIRGIKAGIQKQLLDVGVCTFMQVAAWTATEIDVIMNLPGIKQRPIKDKWQEQARELVDIKRWQREK